MKAVSLNDKDLRDNIYTLRRKLKADIAQVRGLSKDNPFIPTAAVEQFREISKYMRKNAVRRMGTKDLLSTYRQLKYIRNLKSSTPQGAISTSISFEPIKQNILSLSKSKQDEWWRIYEDMRSINPAIVGEFKYEIFDAIDKLFMGGDPTGSIINKIINIIDEAYILEQQKKSRFEISVYISNKIEELL